MADNNISDVLKTSIDSIKSSFDANTVTGEPIYTKNGTVIIPVSKLVVGFASGGIDNTGSKPVKDSTKSSVFEGSMGGTGVTLTPVAFLVVTEDGKVDLLNVNDPMRADPIFQVVRAIENSPELIKKFKEIFKKDEKEESPKEINE